MQDQEQPGDAGKEYSPGGIIRTSDGDTVLAWISPGERYFTAEELRELREAGNSERDEGEVP